MSKKTEDRYNGLTEQGKKNARFKMNYDGYSVFMAVFTEHIKETICAIMFIAVLVLSIFGITKCSIDEKKSKCIHKGLKESSIEFIESDRTFKIYCKDCKETITYSGTVKRKTIKEPTCLEEGLYDETWYFVNFPDTTFKAQSVAEKVSCKLVPEEDEIPSTCLTEGVGATYRCTVCEKISGGDSLPLSDHTYEDVGYLAPTCISTGLTGVKQCIYCEETVGESKSIPIVDHNYANHYISEQTYESGSAKIGVCDFCDAEKLLEYTSLPLLDEFFEYSIDYENNVAKLTSLKKRTKELIIPGYINGAQVKEIPTSLFENNETIESVTINEGVEAIGEYAFKNCISLQNVTFPNSLNAIENSAFYGCREIRRLYIENAEIAEQAFANCKNLRIVELGDGAYKIGKNAFYNCLRLVFFKFSVNANSASLDMFDTEKRFGRTLSEYVKYTSGPNTLKSYISVDYENKYADETIKYQDGFYYYVDPLTYRNWLVSIDIPEKHIVIPTWVDYIAYNTFFGMEDDITSVLIRKNDYDIQPTIYNSTVYSNIKFYFELYDSILNEREIGATYFDEETYSYVEYRSIRYIYSEENIDDGLRHWYYDSDGNIVEWPTND